MQSAILGFLCLKGDFGFVDDDCIPASDWLSKGASYLAGHKDASAVEGLTTIEEIGKLTGAHREYKRLNDPDSEPTISFSGERLSWLSGDLTNALQSRGRMSILPSR